MHLQQTVLVILRFPPEGIAGALSVVEEAQIEAQLALASDFMWTHSRQTLRVMFHRTKFLESLTADDYKAYSQEAPLPSIWAAKYTRETHQSLDRRGLDPGSFAGILMVYRPTNAPGSLFYNTWIWFNDELSGSHKHPGFSSILTGGGPPLWELIVHEYLHQLDHRFEREVHNPDPAQRGFMNPDHQNEPAGLRLATLLGASFPTNVAYYQAVLAYYVGQDNDLHPVNYRWLEGARGTYSGGELKTVYDFADPDDLLIHAGGHDRHEVRGGHPPSFWFRAKAGTTAAFRTQTGLGRHLLRNVAFNYEIAPGDYTFQVRLVYLDNRGATVDVRVDDGIYELGRQKFGHNRKTIEVGREVEDFQIVFHKGNALSGDAAKDDWLLLGNIRLKADLAP